MNTDDIVSQVIDKLLNHGDVGIAAVAFWLGWREVKRFMCSLQAPKIELTIDVRHPIPVRIVKDSKDGDDEGAEVVVLPTVVRSAAGTSE